MPWNSASSARKQQLQKYDVRKPSFVSTSRQVSSHWSKYRPLFTKGRNRSAENGRPAWGFGRWISCMLPRPCCCTLISFGHLIYDKQMPHAPKAFTPPKHHVWFAKTRCEARLFGLDWLAKKAILI